jgi:hypothetical protein
MPPTCAASASSHWRNGPSTSPLSTPRRDVEEWALLASDTHHEYPTSPTETVTEVEFVTYSDGAEHREVIPFRG